MNVKRKSLTPPKVPSSPFTGRKEDSLGRTQCYSEGEHVACGGETAPVQSTAKSREWTKVTDGKKWGNEFFSNWASSLSDGEKRAIDFYKKDSTPINEGLRNENYFRGVLEEHKKQLTRAVEKSSLPHDMIVYRGAAKEFYDNLYVGETFRDKGFVSTSVDTVSADVFTDPFGEGREVIRITILVPKGAKAAYISQVNNDDDTDELLLQRGSQFKVLKVGNNTAILKLLLPKRTTNEQNR